MPAIRLNAVEKKIVSDAMVAADALLAKLDKNKDGILDEVEAKTLIRGNERASKKLNDHFQDQKDNPPPSYMAGVLNSSLTDAERTMMVVMQGIAQFSEENRQDRSISLVDARKATQRAYENTLGLLRKPNNPDTGPFAAIFGARLLPVSAAPLIAQRLAVLHDP